jgi:superfamily II DNA or RNA helicase
MTRNERQQQVIDRWKEVKKGTLLAATGTGKTRIGLNLIEQLVEKNPTLTCLVTVPTENLKDQWMLQVIERGLIQYVDVMVINTAVKQKRKYKLLIIDEVHTSASDTMREIFNQIEYSALLCLTATLERLDGKEEIIKQYAPVFDEISLEAALENGWVAEYKQFKVLLNVDLTEYKKHNAKFMSHFAYFDYNWDAAMKCATDNQFRFAYANRLNLQVRDVVVHGMGFMREMKARKEIIYNHPHKIHVANKILHAREGKKVITFSKTVDAAKELCCGDIYHAGMTKKKRTEMLTKFNDAETGILHTAKALDVGADIKGLEVGLILSGDSSAITKRQRLGRSIRKEGDKVAEFFHFVIKGTVDEKWFATSSKGLPYTTIDEDQLMTYLETGSVEKKIHKETKFLFRF